MFKTKIWPAIKLEFTGWKIFEVALMLLSTTAIITLGVIGTNPNTIAIIAGASGIIGVILGAKGKISAFIVATINSALYIVISIQSGNTSQIILHAAFYIPMNIIGFILWFKNRNKSGDVLPKQLSMKALILIFASMIVIYIGYSFALPINAKSTKAQHWIDALSLITTVFAIILMIFRYVDQWYLWILSNIANIILWAVILINIKNGQTYENITDKEAGIFLAQFAASFINSLYGFWNWFRLYKKSEKYELKILAKEELKQLSQWKQISYHCNKFFTKK